MPQRGAKTAWNNGEETEKEKGKESRNAEKKCTRRNAGEDMQKREGKRREKQENDGESGDKREGRRRGKRNQSERRVATLLAQKKGSKEKLDTMTRGKRREKGREGDNRRGEKRKGSHAKKGSEVE